ncbi:MAG: NAD(P)/FAD-dependent oxidoreductase [Methylococcaceae bacterium]|nr:MAG: NAD(P)/FAD-dependent oxidoreductase [Methylococcaceae bacterium]
MTADVIVIGAGASGLMCAIEAGKRRRKVLVLDHANKAGKKILMSGGGRCNFTNLSVGAENYLSRNPHFCKSALSRFSQWDFIALVQQHRIAYHEREHGQLFCDDSAGDILAMLLSECERAGVTIRLNTRIDAIAQRPEGGFSLQTNVGTISCRSLVIASGGLSIPAMGASPFGYRIAGQFGIKVWPTRAGLVPFTLHPHDKERLAPLSGIAVDCVVENPRQSFQKPDGYRFAAAFRENLLFTHRGLSGPAILQISSYWQPGEAVDIDLLPGLDLAAELQRARGERPQTALKTLLGNYLPKRLIAVLLDEALTEKPLQHLSRQDLTQVAAVLQRWRVSPNGTEGYRTAEVTLGGVDCEAVSSKTLESRAVPGLYFTGEVLDVTGWLGGYNLQWAWSSGWCAGQYA